jgi:hypothetical protein
MTYYLFLSDRHGASGGARWGMMGIAVKVAQSVCSETNNLYRHKVLMPSTDWTAYVPRQNVFIFLTLGQTGIVHAGAESILKKLSAGESFSGSFSLMTRGSV